MSASILLVDDDPLLVRMMGTMLGDLGRVRFATSGEAALEQMAREVPDLVLLDAEMPGISGFEVCRTIRSRGEYEDTPVIFVTAHRDEEFEARGFDVGAVDFINKPVSAPTLRARVRTHLRLKQAHDTIRRMSLADPLTGLTNRRAFDGLLAREWKHALRMGAALGMLMIDVDCFRQYNETCGHPAGDACLASVAHALQDALLRPRDVVARYGAKEFVVLLQDTGVDGVRIVAERMLQAVLGLGIPHRLGVAGIVTVSIGGATLEAGPQGQDTRHAHRAPSGAIASLVRRAEQALYQAKMLGRARICLDDAWSVAAAGMDVDQSARAGGALHR